ncbi:MAG: hypothetical protein OXI01_18095 [Albidovulum sp.]|nr:hypothetical protein [Albidovulum sp.]
MPQTVPSVCNPVCPSPRCRLSTRPSLARSPIALLTVDEARPVAHAIDLIGRQ